MAWIRTVKPELFIHEFLYETEYTSGLPIRLAFIGLLTQCDCEGRFRWRPRVLKLSIMPYDDAVDFNLVMDTLLENRFIERYEIYGELYGYIPTWKKHQRITGRVQESKIPEPPCLENLNVGLELHVNDMSITSQQHSNYVSNTCHVNAQEEGNGKEGKGKDICEVSEETSSMSFDHNSIVMEIFHHWQSVMSHPRAKLDPKRKKKIEATLKLGYTADQLKSAIDGCFATPHNMGENSQGKKYNDIELIFRDASHIERFIQNIETIANNSTSNVSQIDQIFSGAI